MVRAVEKEEARRWRRRTMRKGGHGDEEGHVGKVNLMRAKDRQTHMVTGDENEVQGIKEYNKKILPHIE